jgi:regulation of enolase protein 1 (concanavalin A-like superfamily)
MSHRFLFALLSLALAVASVGRGDDVDPEPPVHDPFAGKLRLHWKIVRPDETHYSLTKNKGKLTITTQRGSIYKAEKDRTGDAAKNLFLINNPFGRSADFEVSVCVSDFKPTAFYQQAGLLLYDDDDNYVKFVWESKGLNSGTHLVFIRETDGNPENNQAPTPADADKVWLRLTKRGNKYEYASSGNGKDWTAHDTLPWGEKKGPARFGILAKNAGTDAPDIDACFTDFRARRPAAVRAKSD